MDEYDETLDGMITCDRCGNPCQSEHPEFTLYFSDSGCSTQDYRERTSVSHLCEACRDDVWRLIQQFWETATTRLG